jgi:hydroxymethylglutaryl-CoA reductase (NADPH)
VLGHGFRDGEAVASTNSMPDPSPPARIPRDRGDDYTPEVIARRLALCEGLAGRPLPYLAGAPVAPDEARGKIENLVGFAQVPVGISGPLRVDTSDGVRDVVVPMATTEGAMVASYSRGMRLLRAGGAVRSRVIARGLSQHPTLLYGSAEDALRAAERARVEEGRYRDLVARTTRHGALSKVVPEVLGRRLVLRLVFTTGDAIGVNMAAGAADLISADLAHLTGARRRYVHGQDVEKRANARALVEGRGRSVVAEAVVPRAALAELARTTPEELVEIGRTYAIGYAQLGTQNWLVQAANGLAAVFLACGQDVAYVTECATGYLEFDLEGEDLYASVQLPSLLVGTVGGGALQGTARECLALLGCEGDGAADRFAEILGATVLAGDLSLMAAFTSHEFVAAHEALGRNRPETAS